MTNLLSISTKTIFLTALGLPMLLAYTPATAQTATAAPAPAMTASAPANAAPAPAMPASIPSAAATAPGASAPVFNLTQAIGLSLKSSTDLLVANNNLDKDAAAVDLAKAAGRPQINSDDSYVHLDTPVVIPFSFPGAATEHIIAEEQDKENLAATATLPIDISGQIRATTNAARLQLMADRFERDRIFDGRVLQAQQNYFDLLRAEHQVAVAQSDLANGQAQEAIAQRQFEGGIGQKIDFLRAQSQVATAQQNLLAAQNNVVIQQTSFNDLLGRPLNAPVQAADTPGVTTGTAVGSDVSDESEVNAPLPAFFAPIAQASDLDQGIKTAQKRRPELLADQVDVQAANNQITIARTSNAPTLSISATGDYYPVTDFGTPRHSLGVYAVTLHVPLYDGGATRDRIREARVQTKNATATFTSDQTTVELQVRQAYASLQTATQQIGAANAALQQAIAARRLAQVRYANGVGLYLEVTDAESALTQAETAQVNAVYDYLIARAQYQNAIGAPQLNPQI